jgi:hypothetical protein
MRIAANWWLTLRTNKKKVKEITNFINWWKNKLTFSPSVKSGSSFSYISKTQSKLTPNLKLKNRQYRTFFPGCSRLKYISLYKNNALKIILKFLILVHLPSFFVISLLFLSIINAHIRLRIFGGKSKHVCQTLQV